jgi:hypothetical protein
MRVKKKQPTIKQQRERWYAHVKATPGGMVPVLFMGIPAWNVAMGPSQKVIAHFRQVAPIEHWPTWVRELEQR